MKGLRDDSLAGAVFAADENVGVRTADAVDDLKHGLHGRRLGDELWFSLVAEYSVFGFEPLASPQRLTEFRLSVDDRQQPRIVPGLLNKVARPAAHRLDCDVNAAPGGHHNDRKRAVDLLNPREHVEAFLPGGRVPGVVEVHQQYVEVSLLDRLDDVDRPLDGFNIITFGFEEQTKRLEHVCLIVGDQHSGCE